MDLKDDTLSWDDEQEQEMKRMRVTPDHLLYADALLASNQQLRPPRLHIVCRYDPLWAYGATNDHQIIKTDLRTAVLLRAWRWFTWHVPQWPCAPKGHKIASSWGPQAILIMGCDSHDSTSRRF